MFSIFRRHKMTFYMLLLSAAFFSFYGFIEFSDHKDKDVIESELLLVNNSDVVTISKVPYLNTSEIMNRHFLFNTDYSLADTMTLSANPGPANNGGSPNWAMFLNLIGGTRDVYVTGIKTASTAAAGGPVSFEVYIRDGNALGGPVSSGPGSSTAGWTLIDTATGVQGSTSNGISELIALGPILVQANDTVGVAFKFLVAGPRYFGTGSPPLENYNDTNIRLVTGDGRSAPFTPTGSFFSSRALTGEIRYVVSTTTGITNLNTGVPEGYKLSQNYPNPFNPATNIQFSIPENTNVRITIYNSQGKEVTKLVNGEFAAGSYIAKWDASGISSGVYFYTIKAGNFNQTKKLLLVK